MDAHVHSSSRSADYVADCAWLASITYFNLSAKIMKNQETAKQKSKSFFSQNQRFDVLTF